MNSIVRGTGVSLLLGHHQDSIQHVRLRIPSRMANSAEIFEHINRQHIAKSIKSSRVTSEDLPHLVEVLSRYEMLLYVIGRLLILLTSICEGRTERDEELIRLIERRLLLPEKRLDE